MTSCFFIETLQRVRMLLSSMIIDGPPRLHLQPNLFTPTEEFFGSAARALVVLDRLLKLLQSVGE